MRSVQCHGPRCGRAVLMDTDNVMTIIQSLCLAPDNGGGVGEVVAANDINEAGNND